MAMFAQIDDVPVPPLALNKTINRPPCLAGMPERPFNKRSDISLSRDKACPDLGIYSLNPASRQDFTRATLGSLLRAIKGMFAVRVSCFNFLARSSPEISVIVGSITTRSGRSRHAQINPSLPEPA